MRLENPGPNLFVGDCAIILVPHDTTLLVLLLENIWSNLDLFSQSEKLERMVTRWKLFTEIGNKYLF